MPGMQVSNLTFQETAGQISLNVQKACNDVEEFKRQLDPFTAQALADKFGISLDDANIIKSAYTELSTVAQAQANNRTFSSKLNGVGDVL